MWNRHLFRKPFSLNVHVETYFTKKGKKMFDFLKATSGMYFTRGPNLEYEFPLLHYEYRYIFASLLHPYTANNSFECTAMIVEFVKESVGYRFHVTDLC